MKAEAFFSKLIISFLLLVSNASGVTPPKPGDMAKYKLDGTYGKRVEFYKKLGNDKFDPKLLERSAARLKQLQLLHEGLSAEQIAKVAPLPPPDWRGMPTTGTNKVLAILIEFTDTPHSGSNTQSFVHSCLFGNGISSNYPYESLSAYYKRSSFGKLNITGNTLGWYKAPYNRDQVEQTTNGREKLVKEALRYFESLGHDFSQYDNDGDGDIDYFIVVYAGANNGWGNFWWAYQTGFEDHSFKVGGKRLSTYVFQFQNYDDQDAFSPSVVIHETGHALGLPDLYDYDANIGPRGGLGGLDMMDANRGDHNGFCKWILEWITPKVISSGSTTVELRPAGTTGDAVIVMPHAVSNPFREYFLVQNRSHAGNDDADNWPGTGLAIWHVDARLNQAGNNYLYDNQTTVHKLLRVMEADGKEEIEQGFLGNAGDFFYQGMKFGSDTKPGSAGYDGMRTGVFVKDITKTIGGFSATIGIDAMSPIPVQLPTRAFLLNAEP